jgi:hypothetical protein
VSRPKPLACPGHGNAGAIWSPPLNRAGPSRLRLGLAPRALAGPLGLLALGSLRPELVMLRGPGAATCSQRAGSVEPALLLPETGAGRLRGGLARDVAEWEWRLWLLDRWCVSSAVLDRLDHWLMQARLWLADTVCDP